MVKFHWAPETNSAVESETVIKLNQAKYAMTFLDSDDTLFNFHCNTITMAKPNTTWEFVLFWHPHSFEIWHKVSEKVKRNEGISCSSIGNDIIDAFHAAASWSHSPAAPAPSTPPSRGHGARQRRGRCAHRG
jgi:hypothetical protein